MLDSSCARRLLISFSSSVVACSVQLPVDLVPSSVRFSNVWFHFSSTLSRIASILSLSSRSSVASSSSLMALTFASTFCSVSSTARFFSSSCSNRCDSSVYLASSSCFRSVEPSCMVRLSF
uniref:Putative secreted protein n=1 Tax=Anopheles marajoara TaxID=58244 RepID=A0A2M4C7L4_9DIPT